MTIAQQSLYDWAQQSPLSGNPRALVWELAREAERTGGLEFDWSDDEVAARLRIHKKTVKGIVDKVRGFVGCERVDAHFRTLFRVPAPSMVEKVSPEMPGEKVSPTVPSLKDFSSFPITQTRREEERESRKPSLSPPPKLITIEEFDPPITGELVANVRAARSLPIEAADIRGDFELWFKPEHGGQKHTRERWLQLWRKSLRNVRPRAAPTLWSEPQSVNSNAIERSNSNGYQSFPGGSRGFQRVREIDSAKDGLHQRVAKALGIDDER